MNDIEINIGVSEEMSNTLKLNNYRKQNTELTCKDCMEYKWLKNLNIDLCCAFKYGIPVNRYYVCDKFTVKDLLSDIEL